MGIFDQKRNSEAQDPKSIRDEILYEIRRRLSALQGGEGRNLSALNLYLAPPPAVRALYEAAVNSGDEDGLRSDIERIGDDYDLGLPARWELHTTFCDVLPEEATPLPGHPAGLWISTGAKKGPATRAATLHVLHGEAEQAEYRLDTGSTRINIGRERQVQLPDGFSRVNAIAFIGDSSLEANRFVSRQHAHIEYDAGLGQFLLYADAGGLPPQNKTKVKPGDGAPAIKLQSGEVPHLLRHGDQIMLGHAALLEFRTEPNNHG